MNIPLSQTKFLLYLNPAILLFVNSVVTDLSASTIATSIVHSKLDYCNSLYFNLPKSQVNRLQLIQNSLARAVVKASKSSQVFTLVKKSMNV